MPSFCSWAAAALRLLGEMEDVEMEACVRLRVEREESSVTRKAEGALEEEASAARERSRSALAFSLFSSSRAVSREVAAVERRTDDSACHFWSRWGDCLL